MGGSVGGRETAGAVCSGWLAVLFAPSGSPLDWRHMAILPGPEKGLGTAHGSYLWVIRLLLFSFHCHFSDSLRAVFYLFMPSPFKAGGGFPSVFTLK